MQLSDRQFAWSEKYRPRKISDCILPKEVKDTFQDFVTKKTIPNLMLTGTPGIGKTTIAMALCNEVGCDHLFIPTSSENGIQIVRDKITQYASSVSLSGGHKVIILDECDGTTRNFQDSLRGAMQEFASNCSFIFTCNFASKMIDAMHSRCSVVDFKIKSQDRPKMALQFLRRIEEILNLEGVTYDRQVLTELIMKYFPDFRRTLNELQTYVSRGNGTIDVGILGSLSGVDIKDLVAFLKAKDFSKMRKWVAQNVDMDTNSIYRKIYDSLYDFLKPETIPPIVLIIAKYGYQDGLCADPEVNLVACLVEIMIEGGFK